jgi:hypothetical protein
LFTAPRLPLISAENENAMTWFRPEASESTSSSITLAMMRTSATRLSVLKLTYLSKNYEHNVS